MEEESKGYFVICPLCGKVNQKAYKTDSYIICSKCKNEFYTYINVNNGIVMYASNTNGSDPRKRILSYAKAFTNIKEDQTAT